MSVKFDPEYLRAIEPMLPMLATLEKPAKHDIAGRRALMESFLTPMFAALPLVPDVDVTIHDATAPDGTTVAIHYYQKKDSTTKGPGPAILHTHGGGYIGLDAATYTKLNAAMASATGVPLFSVDYRLAPEHPFPVPVEDCYTALRWLHEHAEDLKIDRSRIAVYGDSAGGGLAAALAIMARDRKLSPPLAKQVLVYPMIDDRNQGPSPIEQFLTWTVDDNITGWTAYLGDQAGKEGVSAHAAPARVASVEGLPPTYLDVGGLDLFRAENMQYAARLADANIEVEFHLYPGVQHAFEGLAQGTELVNKVLANRIRALTSF